MELKRGKKLEERIGENERRFGKENYVIEEMRNEEKEVWKYGDKENYELRKEIEENKGMKDEKIMKGDGVDELIGIIVSKYVKKGEKVIK